jgi:hypothetical protein
MGEEDSVKDQDQEGYRSLWEMLQSPVRYTVRYTVLVSQVQAISFIWSAVLVRLSVIGQNKLSYDWSE